MMNKSMRLLVVLFFLGLGAVFLYPTVTWYFLTSPEQKALANSSREQIRTVAREKANEDLETLIDLAGSEDTMNEPLPEELSFLVSSARTHYRQLKRDLPAEWTVVSTLAGFRDGNEVYREIEDHYRQEITDLKNLKNRTIQLGLDLSGGMSVVLEADAESLENRLERVPSEADLDDAVSRALEILNNRIDQFGVTEPEIRKQANDQILIEIPGEVDPERVNSFLMGKGSLGFHIVDDETSAAVERLGRENVELDAGLVVRGFFRKDEYGIDQFQRDIVIVEEAGLDGGHIQDARVIPDQLTGQPNVVFQLDPEGGEIFYKFTTDNVDRTLAVVMDNKVKAAARISEPIRDSVRMTGFANDEARDLSLVLRTAALPVDLEIQSQQAVGASLGSDTIQAGLNAIAFGFLAVILFMILYYRGAGIIAAIALVLNLYLVLAVLSSFNLTLTMTSIAGIILNVGMAVDANVIVFERIREELRLGKSRASAVESGYRKAFWTVMDANITTFIAAIFLSQLGKGPIQGFAVTLAVGILCTLFTALYVSRLFFDFGTETLKRDKISIGWGLKK